MRANQILIMRPFNGTFFLCFAVFAALLAAASILLRGKSERTRQIVLVTACIVTFVGFFLYKYSLSVDEQFRQLNADRGGFNWWDELPLHLCNINMMLIPIAVLTKKRPLMAFCFFMGPLGALLAIVIPDRNFMDVSLLLPRMLGYYGTHFMIIIEALAVVSFGFYRPRFRDLPGTVAALAGISLVVFCINLLFRHIGVNPVANYFFTCDPLVGTPLEMVYSWIPVPYLYMVPVMALFAVYMALVTLPFALTDRKKAENSDLEDPVS